MKIAMALETMGIDFIDVSVGLYETGITCVEPISYPQGWRRELIKAVKDHVHIPVVGVSSIREFALPIIVGIISGVYSANMINGYVWAFLEEKKRARKAAKA